MKIKPTAPVDAAAEAERALAQRTAELDTIRAEIAAVESSLYRLAESDDDTAFEAASLNIARLERALLRAEKRRITAEVALGKAMAVEEQDRRQALYAAGQKAAAEAERLAGEYAKHASAIADILRKIDKLRPAHDAANADLPEGERAIDAHAFELFRSVELPAPTKGGEGFWWRADYYGRTPLSPPLPQSPGHILIDGICVLFDEANPAHIAARHARPSMGQPAIASKSPSQPTSEFGERTLPDGTRKITIPPNEWPPKPASVQH